MPFLNLPQLTPEDTFDTWFNATNTVLSHLANSKNYVATATVTTGNVTLNGSATIHGSLTSNANTYLHGTNASDAVLYVTKTAAGSNVLSVASNTFDIVSGTTTFYAPGALNIQTPTMISASVNVTSNVAVSNATSNTVIAPGRIEFNNGNAINATSYSGTAYNATNLNSQPASYYTNAGNLTGSIPSSLLSSASATANGIVDTIQQTFAGVKTFTSNVIVANSGVTITRSDTGATATARIVFQQNSSTFSGANANNGTFTVGSRDNLSGKFVIYSHGANNGLGADVVSINATGCVSFTNCVAVNGLTVGYLEVPQVSKSEDYTVDVVSDSGKHIFHPASDNTPRTFTISSDAVNVGTVLTFINMSLANVTIARADNPNSLYLSGNNAQGNRTLAQSGMATAIKINSSAWLISGTGLT